MRLRLEKDDATVLLNDSPLKRAGEGAVYLIPERPGLLAKIYHQPTPERADKLAAMIAAPPDNPTARQGHASIAWPTDRLLADDANRCVGFVMPYIEKTLSLFEVYNPKQRQRIGLGFPYDYLMQTARNLAVAVQALHRRDYVLGDLNEVNVLVNSQTMLTVIDTDSFQVRAGDRLFRCLVGKPDYTAPEIQNADFSGIDRKPEQDNFALAVLIFQLLMQGTHPFAAHFTGAGDPLARFRLITDGYWPYADNLKGPYGPSRTAPPFAMLAPQVQALMRRCFDDGHNHPSKRPGAAAWIDALNEARVELTECPANAQHLFHKSQEACPWCELERKQGRILFPPKEKGPASGNGSIVPKPPQAAVAVPEAKPTPAVPPPPPKPQPRARIGESTAAARLKLVIAWLPPVLRTPWPWVIAGGAVALLVLVSVVVANARRPAAPPVAILKPADDDATPAPKADHTEPLGRSPEDHGPIVPPAAPPPPTPAPPPPLPASLHLLPIADVALEAGEGKTVAVRVERRNCPGPIELRLEGLPDGVQVQPALIAADADSGQLELTAASGTASTKQAVRLVAVAADARSEDQFQIGVSRTPAKEFAISIGIKLKQIPAGTFLMGSAGGEAGRYGDEGPQHSVEITKPFSMGVYPVTKGQFAAFVKDASYQTDAEKAGNSSTWKNPGFNQTDDDPVVDVTRNDAVKFCEWLSQKEGKTYELPTEAEWEYACRAGTKTAFSFGDDSKLLGDYAWYKDNSGGHTHPVGGKKANPWGLYDMHGNVWQWCADYYDKDYYKNSLNKDPQGPNTGALRVLRGGSWLGGGRNCRAACRYGGDPGDRDLRFGFRVVCDAHGTPPPPVAASLRLLSIADVALEAGESKTVAVRVERRNCPGPIELRLEGLPDGVQARPALIPADADAGQVELTAAADAAATNQAVRLVAVAAAARSECQFQVDVSRTPSKDITTNSIGMKLVLIPAGKFTMGSPEGEAERGKDETAHSVEISQPFYLGVYAVTQAEYQKVVGSNPSYFSAGGGGRDKVAGLDTTRFPVEQVSWDDAVAFCAKLSALEAEKTAGRTYRLPTESEWEYACRAGTATAYSFGDDPKAIDDYAWYMSDSGGHTHPVDGKKANPWGLYDMHGNVWQWCADGYGP